GVGIAEGYATIGAIGFEGRWDYGAIGTVTNLAARLCNEAKGGQVLIASRVATAVEGLIEAEAMGSLSLKGLARPVPTFNVVGLKSACRADRPSPLPADHKRRKPSRRPRPRSNVTVSVAPAARFRLPRRQSEKSTVDRLKSSSAASARSLPSIS